MNVLDILATSPHYFYSKWIGTTNENFNFDLRVYRVNLLSNFTSVNMVIACVADIT